MEDLRHFSQFVDDLLESNSRLHKLAILSKYQDDDVVKYFLNFVFNPYVVTGISTKKLNKDLPLADPEFTTVHSLLEYLKQNNTGKDETIAKIQSFARTIQDDKLIELLHRIICKNLPLGIDTISINKQMPGLIPTFNVQLSNKYFDNMEVVKGHYFTITTKIDGGRILAIKRKGDSVKFYTRAGQLYEGLVDLEEELNNVPLSDFVLDGEITLLDSEGLDSKAQYKKTMMITRKDGEKHGVKMKCFDFLTFNDWQEQGETPAYYVRRNALEQFFNSYRLKFFEKLPVLYNGNDPNAIIKLLNIMTEQGEEGVMVNLNDAPYCFGRGNALLKVKKMKDVDLTIIGFEEGTNKNAGKLGAFIVDYEGNEVRVGSGISSALRDIVWQNRDEYLGRTISVQYFEETTNQNGGKSLRFPVFLDFRFDK